MGKQISKPKPMLAVGTRIPEATYKAIERKAEREQRDFSEVVRMALVKVFGGGK
jgi:hypothetical protein